MSPMLGVSLTPRPPSSIASIPRCVGLSCLRVDATGAYRSRRGLSQALNVAEKPLDLVPTESRWGHQLNSQDLGSISRGLISGSRPTLVPPNAVSKCRVAAARRQCARVVRVGSELDLGAPDFDGKRVRAEARRPRRSRGSGRNRAHTRPGGAGTRGLTETPREAVAPPAHPTSRPVSARAGAVLRVTERLTQAARNPGSTSARAVRRASQRFRR
jgi:hypothetical protein